MKALVLTTALLLSCGSAYADSCKVEAGSKKLAGAAMTSFMAGYAGSTTALPSAAAWVTASVASSVRKPSSAEHTGASLPSMRAAKWRNCSV